MPRKGEEEGWPATGAKKDKRTRENRSVIGSSLRLSWGTRSW